MTLEVTVVDAEPVANHVSNMPLRNCISWDADLPGEYWDSGHHVPVVG